MTRLDQIKAKERPRPDQRDPHYFRWGELEEEDVDYLLSEAEKVPALEAEVARLREVEVAAMGLSGFVRKSLNVGPITSNPRKEAYHWQQLHKALAPPEMIDPEFEQRPAEFL